MSAAWSLLNPSATTSPWSNVVMKACTALPWRGASISQQRCRYCPWMQILRHASTEGRRNHASPIVTQTDATHPDPDIDQGNKTIATPVGDLPLSPIMDPSYWEATTRHQVPKQKKGKAQNSVERQFRKNAFGTCCLELLS
ncbi:hypothetical protein O1611_g9438 [Lasiodiplodia mahajangana]|uniref:Uncharacterized protein n=1 Tax=Lasiodiplodia mahajangana TaxID=1108764 RepID=A0ACC2J9R7_9PEZI|nr:hypothetical protein O1611_g9438 [Lasiodiplodia mahajangana]